MRANEEYNLALAVSKYLKLQYPGTIFRFDMAGLNLSKAQAGQMKSIQHSRAYPDLFILKAGRSSKLKIPFHGLFLELKKKGTKIYKKDGSYATPHIKEQAAMIEKLIDAGYAAFFVCGFDQAKFYIDEYMKSIS